MKITPFPDQILVEPIKDKGILEEVACSYGTVTAIGKNVKNVSVGQVIGYSRYGLKFLEIEGKEAVFIHKDSDFLLGYIEL